VNLVAVTLSGNERITAPGCNPGVSTGVPMICLHGASTLKLSKLGPIFPGLILMACSGPPIPPSPQVIELPSRVEAGQGIDLPTDASDVLNELEESRVEFVARYYRTPESRWPALSASEAQRLSSLGVKIVAVWESHSRDPAHFSYSSGYGDAVMAYWQARAVGQPAGSAIYFAVDFNAPLQTLAGIDDYFRGVAAGFAAASGGNADYRIGVYGSGAVCDAVKRTGLAQYSWLSSSIAWTDSTSYEDWNIRQGTRSAELSFNHDSDEGREEYGAFRLASHSGSSDNPPRPHDVGAPPAPQGGQPLVSAAIPLR
jgi:glycoside hydrolase-like protein